MELLDMNFYIAQIYYFRLGAVTLRRYIPQLLTAIKLLVKSRAQEMTSIASKFERYINYHLRKEMMRERERMIFSNEFWGLLLLYFYNKAAISQMKIFMVKVLKQRSISNLFSTLAYKRIKIKALKSVTY